ncbi:hypothetical protein Tco_0399791, partial [Tanacetum coccineum]
TNEVSTTNGDIGVSTAGGTSQVPSTPCAHDIDEDDLEELDLRWQVAMLTVRVKKKGHFATGRNQGRISYGDNGRSNTPTNEFSSQTLVAQDGLRGYDWSKDFEVEPVNYALMAISSSSSSSSFDSEVQKCSKQCIESFKTLQKNYDTEREKHNNSKQEIRGYEIAIESLESRILGHEKNELAWGEKYEFQNYELKCREIKINNLNMELEKVVKERDELKDKIAKREESTKNLDEILNSQRSARDKTSLGYSTKLNELNSNHETDSENSLSIFDVRLSDEENTPENDRFLKNVVNTGKREGKPVWDNTKRVNHQKISKYPHLSETFIPSGVPTRTGLHRPSVSTARPSVSTTRPVSTARLSVSTARLSVSTARPVCTVKPSVSTARPVCTARPSISTARPVCTAKPSVSTARPVCVAKPSVSTARPVYATRPTYPRMDNVRPRGSCSPIKRSYYTKPAFRLKDLKQDVKTFGVQNMTTAGTRAVVNTGKGKLDTDLKKSRWVWRPKGNYLDHVSKDSRSFMLKKGNPEILLQDHAVVDSGCSSHMTGNKAYLSDYEDFNGGFVAFGSDPKGDELKFNLFSVSQMCDKKNSVLFTESECLILSPSFKLLDESQVVLRAPRKDDVYSLDLKNIVPSGGTQILMLPVQYRKDKAYLRITTAFTPTQYKDSVKNVVHLHIKPSENAL